MPNTTLTADQITSYRQSGYVSSMRAASQLRTRHASEPSNAADAVARLLKQLYLKQLHRACASLTSSLGVPVWAVGDR
eukprot:COSAG02_NODE_1982_length_10196_cov_6.214816_1_plen_78_part_00